MKYYDIPRHWTRRIEPHLGDEKLNKILVRDFGKFTWGRWRQRFEPGMRPRDFEGCDWGWDHRGPEPRFWQFVKHAACHWLVNFALRLAQLTEPTRPWRIVTSDKHSTVWDGKDTLFDLGWMAMGIPAQEAWEAACWGQHLEPGQHLKVYTAERAKLVGVNAST